MKTKRLIAVLLIAAIGCGLCTACGSSQPANDAASEIDRAAQEIAQKYISMNLETINNGEPVTIRVHLGAIMPTLSSVATPEQPDVFNSTEILRKAFQMIYPNVTVEWARTVDTSDSDSLLQYLTTQLSSKTAPDIVFAFGSSFADRNWFYDFNGTLSEPNIFIEGNTAWRDQFPKYLFAHWSVSDARDQVVGIPLSCSAGTSTGLFYNKQIFSQLNLEPPRDWSSLMAVTQTLKENGYVAFAPWGGPGSGNRKPSTQVWDVQMSLGPFYAEFMKDDIDYNHDGIHSQAEKLRAAYEGYYFAESNPNVMDMWRQVKRKYTQCMETGYENTDYESKWLLGKVGILEDCLWRYPEELSNTERQYDFGVVPPPVIDTATTSYINEPEYTEKGPYRPAPTETYSILMPSVEAHGGAPVLDACVKFLQFLMVPDNNNMIVLEQKGKSIGFLKESVIPQELSEYFNQSFPKVPSFDWPGGFTSSGSEKMSIMVEMWVKDQMTDEEFARKFDEEFKKDIDDYIESLEIDTTGWVKGY